MRVEDHVVHATHANSLMQIVTPAGSMNTEQAALKPVAAHRVITAIYGARNGKAIPLFPKPVEPAIFSPIRLTLRIVPSTKCII